MSEVYAFLTTYQVDNPLISLELPFLDDYVSPYVFPYLPIQVQTHFHQIIATIILYHSIYVLSVLFSPLLFPNIFKNLSKRTQVDFHVHIVSMIQSISILILCIPFFVTTDHEDYIGNTSHERVFGSTGYLGLITTLALGYFTWDALISTVYVAYFGPGFLIHGIMSAMVYFIGLTPFIQYYAPIFILFEISTPFLNLRWFGLKIPGLIPESFQLVNNAILILIFFLVRICFGWYQAFTLFSDFYYLWDHELFSPFSAVIIFTGNMVLNVLNIYWFYRMVKVAYAILADMFTGSTAREEAKKDI